MNQQFSEAEELAVFGSSAGPLDESGGFNDFWGTIVGYKMVTREFKDEATGTTRITRQLQLDIETDEGVAQYEWFGQPTDSKTGQPRLNKDGKPTRPHAKSKWGLFETRLQELGVPTETLAALVGLHAHFTYNEIEIGSDKEKKPIIVKGRFVTDWDHYNNKVRQEGGLPALGATHESGAPAPAVPTPTIQSVGTTTVTAAPAVSAVSMEERALAAVIGKSTIEYYAYVQDRANGLDPSYASKPKLEEWQAGGLVKLGADRKFAPGDNYPSELVTA